MNIYTFDPKKEKTVLAGIVEEDVFYRDVRPEHLFRKYDGYGESIDVLYQLRDLKVKVLLLTDEVKSQYFSRLEDWFNTNLIYTKDYGHGIQNILPREYMRLL